VGLHDGCADRESEPRALLFGRKERVEHPLQQLGRNTRTCVHDGDDSTTRVDRDLDSRLDGLDNCPAWPNGPALGSCTSGAPELLAARCTSSSDCGVGGFCSRAQEDADRDGTGDACETILLPEPDATVRIIAQQWAWSFVHPGPDGKLDTDDDIKTVDDLHLEVGKTYHYLLESRDVLHSLSIPVFRLKQDAIPGRVVTGWFKPITTGEHDIQCAEICGIGHGLMPARVILETPEQHAAWMAGAGTSPAPGTATGE